MSEQPSAEKVITGLLTSGPEVLSVEQIKLIWSKRTPSPAEAHTHVTYLLTEIDLLRLYVDKLEDRLDKRTEPQVGSNAE